MDFANWQMNLDLWRDTFNTWVDLYLGDASGDGGGLVRGPLIAFLAITIVGAILFHGREFLSQLFSAPLVRNNRVGFKGVEDASWGTDKEVDELLAMAAIGAPTMMNGIRRPIDVRVRSLCAPIHG